ncbi:MAG TPA: VanZ family protein [Usitatibacter sp.]
MTSSRYRGSLAVWALLIAYASLYPFVQLRLPSMEAALGYFSRPRYVTAFDVTVNVLAYAPLGTLACLYFRQADATARAILKAAACCAAFSFAMEFLQLFVVGRVASMYDTLANAAGALWGALVFADPFYSLVTRPLGERRERFIVAGAWGDAGLALVMLWMIAQLNPALPFFGAGNIVGAGADPGDLVALQWAAVAASIWGFGLFVSSLLRGEHGALRTTLVLLSVALWLKFVAATFMLQPHFAEEWLSVGRVLGLIAGIAMLVPSRRFGRALRIYLALMLVLAGALFSKIVGSYSPLDDFLRLFRWPYGQLASFATLTRFIHEAWPFMALVFLIALFLRVRREAMP